MQTDDADFVNFIISLIDIINQFNQAFERYPNQLFSKVKNAFAMIDPTTSTSCTFREMINDYSSAKNLIEKFFVVKETLTKDSQTLFIVLQKMFSEVPERRHLYLSNLEDTKFVCREENMLLIMKVLSYLSVTKVSSFFGGIYILIY